MAVGTLRVSSGGFWLARNEEMEKKMENARIIRDYRGYTGFI